MDGESSAAAQTEDIAEGDDIDTAVITAGTHNLTCDDGDCRRGEADAHARKVNRSGGRLGRRTKARQPLLSRLDHAMRVNAEKSEARKCAASSAVLACSHWSSMRRIVRVAT
jgi:hypothetical protein